MTHEASKAMRRRLRDPMFSLAYMRGKAIDIGCGYDSIGRQLGYWPLLRSVDEWDFVHGDGDAQELKGVADNTYDLVHSAHCLEHVNDAGLALARWLQVLRPGGHMVVTIPDWDMYEKRSFPSRFNPDHKTVFTLRSVSDLIDNLYPVEAIKIERILENYDPSLPDNVDQTQLSAECAIEFVVRKSE